MRAEWDQCLHFRLLLSGSRGSHHLYYQVSIKPGDGSARDIHDASYHFQNSSTSSGGWELPRNSVSSGGYQVMLTNIGTGCRTSDLRVGGTPVGGWKTVGMCGCSTCCADFVYCDEKRNVRVAILVTLSTVMTDAEIACALSLSSQVFWVARHVGDEASKSDSDNCSFERSPSASRSSKSLIVD